MTDAAQVWVVDASVWAAYYLIDDVHRVTSRAWLAASLAAGDQLIGPDLLLVEVAAAVTRRAGASDAEVAVSHLLSEPNVGFIPMDLALRDEAVRLAISLRPRGADAVYVAVAQQLHAPLITWDDEQLNRAGPAVRVRTPGP